MELGALVCLPRQPKCPECPVARSCCALKRDCISSFPQKLKRPERPERHLAVGIIFKNNRLLLVQRPNDGFLGGLWELPGGAIAKGADPSEACVKGILRAVNLSVSIVRPVAVIRHTYTHFKLFMQVFECQWCSGRVYRRGSQAHQWIGPSKIDELPLHGAMHKALAAFSNHQRPD